MFRFSFSSIWYNNTYFRIRTFLARCVCVCVEKKRNPLMIAIFLQRKQNPGKTHICYHIKFGNKCGYLFSIRILNLFIKCVPNCNTNRYLFGEDELLFPTSTVYFLSSLSMFACTNIWIYENFHILTFSEYIWT